VTPPKKAMMYAAKMAPLIQHVATSSARSNETRCRDDRRRAWQVPDRCPTSRRLWGWCYLPYPVHILSREACWCLEQRFRRSSFRSPH
jgi:hypothetical protein